MQSTDAPGYIDQQQASTSIHENVLNGYAVFHPDDTQLVQPKYDHSLGYECYMLPATNDLHTDQVSLPSLIKDFVMCVVIPY